MSTRSKFMPQPVVLLDVFLAILSVGPMFWEFFYRAPLPHCIDAVRVVVGQLLDDATVNVKLFSAFCCLSFLWIAMPGIQGWLIRRKIPPPGDWLLLAFLGALAAHYTADLPGAAHSNDALTLAAGIAAGCLVRAWLPAGMGAVGRNMAFVVVVSVGLACLHHWPWMPVFRYRGEPRAVGLWNNPNTFGLLAACAFSGALARLVPAVGRSAEEVHRLKSETSINRTGRMIQTGLLLATCAVAGVGLSLSYSRGAWLGATLAAILVAWWRYYPALRQLRLDAYAGNRAAKLRLRILKSALVVAAIVVPLGLRILSGVQTPLLRRVGTVANTTDRSWRNRVDAWVGTTRMAWDRPWVGWGLNQINEPYREVYRPDSRYEIGAISLNDFLTVAAAMGFPALALLIAVVLLRICPAYRLRHPNVPPLLVLLTGAWFDGVLFRIPLTLPFWTLLLASETTESLDQNCESK